MVSKKKAIGIAAGYAVGGVGGAIIGGAVAGGDDDAGYDMGDIPFGVHVEEEHEDDDDGRRYDLRFLSELPARAHAHIAFLRDDGRRLQGRAPHTSADGSFGIAAPIVQAACSIYVPFESLIYTSPKRISMEVSVWAQRASGLVPKGKAILDASLPAPAAE